jgi:hypothetical protein
VDAVFCAKEEEEEEEEEAMVFSLAQETDFRSTFKSKVDATTGLATTVTIRDKPTKEMTQRIFQE